MKKTTLAVLMVGTLALVACSSSKKEKMKEESKTAHVDLMTPKKGSTGTLDFKETGDGIKVMVAITGLKPNSTHGLHIHEKGLCTAPTYESAGGHFNPDKMPHGGPNSMKKHPGDFGNIVADSKGVATKEIVIPANEVADLKDIEGKSVILHEKADDLMTQPSGNSGGRLACGVIL